MLRRSVLESPPPDGVGANSSSGGPSVALHSSNASALVRGPLLPELALLPWLESFTVLLYTDQLNAGIPTEWGAHNAYPRLKQ